MTIENSNTELRAWTFVEMLVAISLCAIFMGTAALVLQSISHNSKRLTNLITLDIGTANMSNFYNQSGSTLRAYTAPNYGKIGFAQDLREQMLDDSSRCSAVFCLPRSGLNTLRPEFLPFPSGAVGSSSSHPQFDTPEAFRQYLLTTFPTGAAVFDSPIRNVPSPSKLSTSIFMLASQTNPDSIRLYAVYDIDYVTPVAGGGVYVSVKRFKNTILSHYYDIFYQGTLTTSNTPSPQFAVFESKNRLAFPEGAAIDRFKVAPNSPFYLIWLPDPATNPLTVPPGTVTAPPATSPKQAYYKHSRTTAFLLALPMFPSL